jgi:hypothetical protein
MKVADAYKRETAASLVQYLTAPVFTLLLWVNFV